MKVHKKIFVLILGLSRTASTFTKWFFKIIFVLWHSSSLETHWYFMYVHGLIVETSYALTGVWFWFWLTNKYSSSQIDTYCCIRTLSADCLNEQVRRNCSICLVRTYVYRNALVSLISYIIYTRKRALTVLHIRVRLPLSLYINVCTCIHF